MQVPGFILVVLTVLSVLLLIVITMVAFFVIKNWMRLRHYEKIKPTKPCKFIPGKTEACFGESNHENCVLPLMYATQIQSGGQINRSSLNKQSAPNSVSSRGSSRHSRVTVSTFEKRVTPFNVTRVNGMTPDEKRRSSIISKNADIDVRRVGSPTLSSNAGSEFSHTSSRRDSIHEEYFAPEVSTTFLDNYSIYSFENTPERFNLNERFNSNVYSHSHLLQNTDNDVTLVIDPVISYDQEDGPSSPVSTLGSLSFLLQYNATDPELLITVKHATDLPTSTGNTNGSINTYVNLCIVPEDFLWKRTRVIDNDRDPVFNETFQIKDVLYHKLREYTICFYVMDCHPIMGERPIGKVMYPLSDLRVETTLNITQDLIAP